MYAHLVHPHDQTHVQEGDVMKAFWFVQIVQVNQFLVASLQCWLSLGMQLARIVASIVSSVDSVLLYRLPCMMNSVKLIVKRHLVTK